jgi:hypothetical protein
VNEQTELVEIERIVLEGLDVTPERAERIRALVEVELQQRLEQEGLLERLTSGEIRRPAIPALNVDLAELIDQEVAELLVERIIHSLRYAQSTDEEEDVDV